MAIKLYNTLTRRKETFKPLGKDRVGLYTCGPTVYNYAHLGNLRTYIFEDVLRRTLEYAGYKVRHVMNITDVEDKIIRDSQKADKSIFEFTAPYERAFLDDIEKLGIKRAWKYPKATAHIEEMVGLISALIKKGLAYEKEGSVYFDISKFKGYGRLSRLDQQQLKTNTRVTADEYAKDNAQDFALWKAKALGEPSWPAPFGAGRPGWHIECSAMSMKYLGKTFDIHAGGVDLIFPHHENEIAQSEGATGKRFVQYFIEGEHLLVNNERMAKSLGNFYTLRDIEAKGFNPLAFRYLMLTAHYRSKLNFTWESLAGAQQSLDRLYEFVRLLKSHNSKGSTSITEFKDKFENAVLDDLDTPKAVAALWRLISEYHKNPERFPSKTVAALLHNFDQVLGLALKKIKTEKIPTKIKSLADKREKYRVAKAWHKADEIRQEIVQEGYAVEDSLDGPKIRKLKGA